VIRDDEIGGSFAGWGAREPRKLGPNFASDTSSACNESPLVIWCFPIMEMEQ
jgi:hypothetical protein